MENHAEVAVPIVLHFGAAMSRLTDDEFFDFCGRNREWRIERNSYGDLFIMPPTGGDAGRQSHEISLQVGMWAEQDGSGVVFDSSTGFRLPNGANRSPDLAWLLRSRWESLWAEQRQKFPPLAPDFVIELRSPSDNVVELQRKMAEYIENGTRLGLLIDPVGRVVEIYRPGNPFDLLRHLNQSPHPLPEAGDTNCADATMKARGSQDARSPWQGSCQDLAARDGASRDRVRTGEPAGKGRRRS